MTHSIQMECQICGGVGLPYTKNEAEFILCQEHISIAENLLTARFVKRWISNTKRKNGVYVPLKKKIKRSSTCRCGHTRGFHETQMINGRGVFGKCKANISFTDDCLCDIFIPMVEVKE